MKTRNDKDPWKDLVTCYIIALVATVVAAVLFGAWFYVVLTGGMR